MKKLDQEIMCHAMGAIRYICKQEHGKGCKDCPANGKGRMCFDGDLSCSAPYKWWGFKGLERESNDT